MQLTDDEWAELTTPPSHVLVLRDTETRCFLLEDTPAQVQIAIEVTHIENHQLVWRQVIEIPPLMVSILASVFTTLDAELRR